MELNNGLPSEQGFILQHSAQWYAQRRGKLTSSMAYLFMGQKGWLNATSERYLQKKLMELITGESTPETKAYQLTHGTDWEVFVKQYLANKYQAEYFEAEFIQHPDLCYFGGSSDGLITINNIVTTPEIKCPVWEEAMINRKIMQTVELCKLKYPEIYWQCMGNMILQKTTQALAVSFHFQIPEPYTCTKLIIPFNKEDGKLLLLNLSKGYEWLKTESENYGIDIEKRYKEFNPIKVEVYDQINNTPLKVVDKI